MTTYVAPTDPTAVMGRRFGAYFIDLAIIIAVYFGVVASELESADLGSSAAAEDFCSAILDENDGANFCVNLNETVYVSESSSAELLAPILLASALNLWILPSLTGGTVGKLITGIRVVRESDFRRAGFGRNLGRWLSWFVDSFPYCFPLVGLITATTSDRHRRVGDRISGTLVVGRSFVGNPPTAAPSFGGATPWATSAPPAPWSPAGSTPPPPPTAGGAWSPPGSAPPAAQAPWTPPGSATPPPGAWAPPSAADSPAPWAPPSASDAPAPWAPPSSEPVPAPTPQPAAEAPHAGVNAPVWDDARNTYIQWDPELSAWMEWNDVSKQWVPISQ